MRRATGDSLKADRKAVLTLAPDKIQAVAFAEVGAQGESEYVLVISDEGDHIGVMSGRFGFEAFGKRYKRDVDIEKIAEVVPFLMHVVGTSPETTKRGSFAFEDGIWLHLDMAVGNHFFIRGELYEPFRQLLAERNPENLCMSTIDAVLDIMKKEPEFGPRDNRTMTNETFAYIGHITQAARTHRDLIPSIRMSENLTRIQNS